MVDGEEKLTQNNQEKRKKNYFEEEKKRVSSWRSFNKDQRKKELFRKKCFPRI
jgi:hypothetical protein